jgi:hypothetical protein
MMIYYNQGRDGDTERERERERERSIMHREKDNGCGEAYFVVSAYQKNFFSRSISDRIKHFSQQQ